MEQDDVHKFVQRFATNFREEFPEIAEDLRTSVAFRSFRNAVLEMVTIPREAKITREKCDRCGDIVYRTKSS
jgi:hypothetical protein